MTIAQQLNIKTFPFKIKDDQGNLIYRENADGFWVKREFDTRCYRTRYEFSTGFWSKCEYDDQGKMIYLENNVDGVIFDRRPNKEVRDALAVLEKAGVIVDGKIIKI
jgi:hypothetical protein